jgi:hypothetical protein
VSRKFGVFVFPRLRQVSRDGVKYDDAVGIDEQEATAEAQIHRVKNKSVMFGVHWRMACMASPKHAIFLINSPNSR